MSSESNRLLELILDLAHTDGQLKAHHRVAARPERTAPMPQWVDGRIQGVLAARGITQLWGHQVAGGDSIWAGKHTVLTTGTGSGKSFTFWLPIISRQLQARGLPDERGRIESVRATPSALYIAPTKALGADQLRALNELLHPWADADLTWGTCDGDTDRHTRNLLSSSGDTVLTNMDFLHFALLPGHRRWAQFLRRLRYVIIDESHYYRGILATHLSMILLRLRRLVSFYGGELTFVLASATSGDPADFAARLTRVTVSDITVVDRDDSPRGTFDYVLWQPGEQSSAGLEAATLLSIVTRAKARSLAFVRARTTAETVALQTQQLLAQVISTDADLVRTYRGGYLPEDRRRLEQDFHAGGLRALVTTNALELGIDIPGLDVAIVVGWPGTYASWRQQTGRAGRSGRDGLGIFVARDEPLDTYLVNHPQALFDVATEQQIFDPNNPYILAPHMCAAASERPIKAGELEDFGPHATTVLDQLTAQGLLRASSAGDSWMWNQSFSATELTAPRGSDAQVVQIIDSSTGEVIGTLSAADAEAHLFAGAIYTHQGKTFRMHDLDQEAGIALGRPAQVDYTTMSRTETAVAVLEQQDERRLSEDVRCGLARVQVRSQVTGYYQKRLPGLEIIATHPLDFAPHDLHTQSAWFTISERAMSQAGLQPSEFGSALHALEHTMIALLPGLASCDRWDIGGLSTALHQDTHEPTVFIYDALAGGAGFSQYGYQNLHRWVAMTLERLEECPCEAGCPACIQSPKCGNANQYLDKGGAIICAGLLLHALQS